MSMNTRSSWRAAASCMAVLPTALQFQAQVVDFIVRRWVVPICLVEIIAAAVAVTASVPAYTHGNGMQH